MSDAPQSYILNLEERDRIQEEQVIQVKLKGTQPDFNLCRVVDREVRADLPEQTITKILRQGFHLGKKVLRPTEVITSKSNATE
ncbi:MAG: nucleotide exchange factor GrpE [Chroococcus sp. CMT-3BRIN-NPC107]|jgi:molecular chaperone GrpE|nr:nucleotide exchange factor GrpE [Chroococcus sp. CMT-3BRIN-NPC107]